jgi:hypothetical protein
MWVPASTGLSKGKLATWDTSQRADPIGVDPAPAGCFRARQSAPPRHCGTRREDRASVVKLPMGSARCRGRLCYVAPAVMHRASRSRGLIIALGALTAALCLCEPASAQNKGAAQVLFEAGRRAASEGDYATACRKFDESNRMEPAVGTLLNLGNCEEQQGRWATSWLRYTEALTKLRPEDKRYVFAKSKADELEPRIPRLVLVLAEDAPTNTTLSRNGEPVVQTTGSPMRLDPGKYTIRVEAPGHRPATYDVVLFEGDEEHLTVAPGEAQVSGPAPVAGMQKDTPPKGNTRRTMGYAFGGAGVAVGLAGLTFGALTFAKYLTVDEHCDHDAQGWKCRDTTGDDAIRTGATYELVAYGLGAVSLASMGVGAYFLLADSASGTTEVQAGPIDGSMGLRLLHTF